MKTIDLSIIVVNWNSKDYVRDCVASIYAHTFEIEYEIIVVDSASFDGCGDMLQRLWPKVRFIQSENNVGFARANNLGATLACGRALLFLNPDTEVRGHAIRTLYALLHELPQAGIVACRLLNSDGSLQLESVQPLPTILNQVLAIELMQRLFPKIDVWLSAATFKDRDSPAPVEVVSGACGMVSRDAFEQVGGFSTDYFMYAEDLDLCYKVCAAGYINYYVPEVEIVHHGGGSTKHRHSRFASVMIRESVNRLLMKTRGTLYSKGYRIAMTAAAVVRMVLLILIFPIALVKKETSRWSKAFDKWIGIFRWGLGMERWVHYIGDNRDTGSGEDVGREPRCG